MANNQDTQFLLSKLVRMEALEQKLGIQLNHISMIPHDNTCFYANFEVLSYNEGPQVNLYVNIVVYDKNNYILTKEYGCIYKDEFFGFDVLSIFCNLSFDLQDISRILIYPSIQ